MANYKEYLYWPKDLGYAIPWYLCPILYLLVAGFNILGSWNTFSSMPKHLTTSLLLALLLLSLNGFLLWIHMRPLFLTWGTGRKQFRGTFSILTVVYLAISGMLLVVFGRAQIDFYDLNSIDWPFTANCLDFGLLGLTLTLLITSIWKNHEPGVSNLRQERDTALNLARHLRRRKIEEIEYKSLDDTLEQAVASSKQLSARLSGSNLNVLSAWRKGAEQLRKALHGIPYEELDSLREEFTPALTEAISQLEQTQ